MSLKLNCKFFDWNFLFFFFNWLEAFAHAPNNNSLQLHSSRWLPLIRCWTCATNPLNPARQSESHWLTHSELLIEWSDKPAELEVDVFIISFSLSCPCDGLFFSCIRFVLAEEEGPGQAVPSLPAVELPRKRKGDVEERSDAHVQ